MKRIIVKGALYLCLLGLASCTTNDVKEISGTLIFSDIGDHDFHINADNIMATVTIIGPNSGETMIIENVTLYRTSNYHARIASDELGTLRSELLNNLVVMYSADAGSDGSRERQVLLDPGYIRIDWKGFN